MQWTPEPPNAGFCPPDVKPWMRVNDDYPTVNAEVETTRSGEDLSIFQFWARAIANRKKQKEVFVYGAYKLIGDQDEDCPVFAYKRWNEQEAWVVVLNFSGKEERWKLPEIMMVKEWAAGNYSAGKIDQTLSGELVLRPWEGLLGELKKD
jgi:oligo-1,6-glucosidase